MLTIFMSIEIQLLLCLLNVLSLLPLLERLKNVALRRRGAERRL